MLGRGMPSFGARQLHPLAAIHPNKVNYIVGYVGVGVRMEGRKDISDMSFEEFFSKKEGDPPMQRPAAKPAKAKARAEGEVQAGFGTTLPKVNYLNRTFQLYIPRFGSDENARFEASIDCASGVVPMGRLGSVPRGAGRQSRPATLDLTGAGISPFDRFKLMIDGETVFENKPRSLQFFNNAGMPVGKPAGDVYIVFPKGRTIRSDRMEEKDSFDVGDVRVVHAEVSLAGGVWLNEPGKGGDDAGAPEGDAPADAPAPAPEAGKPEPKAKKAKKKKAAGSLKLPAGAAFADAVCNGEVIPIYAKPPVFQAAVENCEPEKCAVSVERPDGTSVAEGSAVAKGPMFFELSEGGVMDLVLRCEGVELARARFALVPDLACERPGNGDVTDDTVYTLTAFGSTVSHDSADGPVPFDNGGTAFAVQCYLPCIEWDAGSGFRRYSGDANGIEDVDVDALGDRLRIKANGARRFSLFVGPEKGKKAEIPMEKAGDLWVARLEGIKNEIFASNQDRYVVFITVNSFPMRKFISITNPERVKAGYADGAVSVHVLRPGEFRCRFYMKDKSVQSIALEEGDASIPVPEDAVEAEVAEVAEGGDRAVIPVKIRPLPFLDRDETGEIWMYVSRSKRIPLPGSLSASKPDPAAIKQWHDQIVRMNPELKGVSAQMMQSAFDAMQW